MQFFDLQGALALPLLPCMDVEMALQPPAWARLYKALLRVGSFLTDYLM